MLGRYYVQGNLIVDDARHHSTFLLPTPAPTNFQKKKKIKNTFNHGHSTEWLTATANPPG